MFSPLIALPGGVESSDWQRGTSLACDIIHMKASASPDEVGRLGLNSNKNLLLTQLVSRESFLESLGSYIIHKSPQFASLLSLALCL